MSTVRAKQREKWRRDRRTRLIEEQNLISIPG